jgi:hypothetical protein
VDDGRVVTLSVGHHTTFVELDEDELNEGQDETPSTPWALVANDAGEIEVAGTTPVGAFARRMGGVRRGSLTAPLATTSLALVVASFMTTTVATTTPAVTPPPAATPTTAAIPAP